MCPKIWGFPTDGGSLELDDESDEYGGDDEEIEEDE